LYNMEKYMTFKQNIFNMMVNIFCEGEDYYVFFSVFEK
jgi:hypothetical protein